MGSPIITWEEGWSKMEAGITKVKRIVEGDPEARFDSEEYMSLYTTVFKMCRQQPPYGYSYQLYDRYRETIEDYCNQTVLPSLRNKCDEDMLRELATKWSNHNCLVKRLTHFFPDIDRYMRPNESLPTLNEVALTSFRDLVYNEIQSKVTKAVIALMNKDREGEEIDRALLKNVLEIYVEMGMKNYVDDFERFMIQDSTSYYSRKASSWIQEDSGHEYMLKSEECVKQERERVIHYIHLSTEPKLVKALKKVFETSGKKIVAGSSK